MSADRRLLTGLAANFVGQGVNAVASFAFIPAYIALLGIESYGLIGVFTVVLTAATLLDAGMTPTLNREMASYRAGQRNATAMRNLLFSVLLVCGGMLMVAGVASTALAPVLARTWLPPSSLPPVVIAHALTLMGIVATLRVIEGLLRGVLLGLQRPVLMNTISSVTVLVRAAGVLIPLAFFPSVTVFFLWQAAVCLIGIVALIVGALRTIGPVGERPRFDGLALARLRGFAGGIFATSLIALVLGQADKIILVKLTSLETFGYYAIGVAVSAVLYQGVLPISQAYFPHFTVEYARPRGDRLAASYHQASQLVAVVVAAAASFVFAFAAPLLLTWSGKADVALQAGPLLRILVVASSFHCFMYIPYMLQLAAGWSRLAVVVNGVTACLYLPSLWWAASRHGALGAATALGVSNLTALLVTSALMHRRLLKGEWSRWLTRDIVPPVMASAAAAFILSSIMPLDQSRVVRVGVLGATGLLILLAAALASSDVRRLVLSRSPWPAKFAPEATPRRKDVA